MPPRKFYRKKRAPMKRKRFSRRRRSRLVQSNHSSNSPVAYKFINKMKYHLNTSITTTVANTAVSQGYSLNALSQPALSGATHQPYGHDTMALMYESYRVFATHWRIEIEPSSTLGTVTVIPQNNAVNYNSADLGYIGEVPRAVTKTLSSVNPTVFIGRCNCPKLAGLTSAQYKAQLAPTSGAGTGSYAADYGEIPSEALNLYVVAQTDAAVTLKYNITLVYHTESFDPKELSQS